MWQAHGSAIDVVDGDVFAIETGGDAFHKIAITVALCDLLELDAKFVDPLFVRFAQQLVDTCAVLSVAVRLNLVDDES